MDDSGIWQLLIDSFWPLLLAGLTGTIPLALASFALGLVIALAIALLRLSPNRVLSGIARVYVSVIRGTPLLVQLFVIFFGLGSVGIVIDKDHAKKYGANAEEQLEAMIDANKPLADGCSSRKRITPVTSSATCVLTADRGRGGGWVCG